MIGVREFVNLREEMNYGDKEKQRRHHRIRKKIWKGQYSSSKKSKKIVKEIKNKVTEKNPNLCLERKKQEMAKHRGLKHKK